MISRDKSTERGGIKIVNNTIIDMHIRLNIVILNHENRILKDSNNVKRLYIYCN